MKKNAIKIFSIIILLSLLSSCIFTPSFDDEEQTTQISSYNKENEDNTKSEFLKLTYSQKDSLNPYKLQTVTNKSLMPLIYDYLFYVDENFQAKKLLVETYYVDSLEVEVTIKDDVLFSDSSSLTTSDVYYSYVQAKKNSSYLAGLENVKEVQVSNSTDMTFVLNEPDPVFVNCLNFPIIKNKTLSHNSPVGSGRYLIDEEKIEEDSSTLYLKQNPHYTTSKQANFQTIALYDYSDQVSASTNIESGNVDFVFDELTDGNERRINAATVNVPMNNLVFIGMNSTLSGLSRPYLRRAISKALSRDEIVTNAYQNHAVETVGPFNPYWSDVKNIQDVCATADIDAAKELVKESGRSSYEFELIVNENNTIKQEVAQIIAEQLAMINITININVISWSQYERKINNGDFDLYLGEIKIPQNMDISPLLFENKKKPIGIFYPKFLQNSYDAYREGTQALEVFIDEFESSMPVIPICYRNGIIVHSRNILGDISPCQNNVFQNIENWAFS